MNKELKCIEKQKKDKVKNRNRPESEKCVKIILRKKNEQERMQQHNLIARSSVTVKVHPITRHGGPEK
jgi:hypothetical protein